MTQMKQIYEHQTLSCHPEQGEKTCSPPVGAKGNACARLVRESLTPFEMTLNLKLKNSQTQKLKTYELKNSTRLETNSQNPHRSAHRPCRLARHRELHVLNANGHERSFHPRAARHRAGISRTHPYVMSATLLYKPKASLIFLARFFVS